eukprot:GHUV01046704.1.p1 GENE.GHUV01046704.1~~GHUV01046704.1.p1  ORF type:complete len:152 (-),score=24.49 GHUV01046704.1:118-573(-)
MVSSCFTWPWRANALRPVRQSQIRPACTEKHGQHLVQDWNIIVQHDGQAFSHHTCILHPSQLREVTSCSDLLVVRKQPVATGQVAVMPIYYTLHYLGALNARTCSKQLRAIRPAVQCNITNGRGFSRAATELWHPVADGKSCAGHKWDKHD